MEETIIGMGGTCQVRAGHGTGGELKMLGRRCKWKEKSMEKYFPETVKGPFSLGIKRPIELLQAVIAFAV